MEEKEDSAAGTRKARAGKSIINMIEVATGSVGFGLMQRVEGRRGGQEGRFWEAKQTAVTISFDR